MTWQGQGGAGGTGNPEGDEEVTRADWPVPAAPPTPGETPPSPFEPGGPLADDAALAAAAGTGTAPVPEAPGSPPPGSPPPASPPAAPPEAPPVAPIAAATPWAPPDQSSGSWGTPPPGAEGRYAVPGAPGLVYAGAIPRAAAWIVDSFLLGIIVAIVSAPFAPAALGAFDPTTDAMPDLSQLTVRSGIASVLAVVVEAAYFIFLWMSSGRATLGMRLFGLQVGNAADGARLRTDQAVKRWFAYGSWLGIAAIVPVMGALAGLVSLGWTLVLLFTTASSPTKQGLHDTFAGSAVVRPATAGNGLAITCLIVALIVPILAILSIVSLIFVGDAGVLDPVDGGRVDLTGERRPAGRLAG